MIEHEEYLDERDLKRGLGFDVDDIEKVNELPVSDQEKSCNGLRCDLPDLLGGEFSDKYMAYICKVTAELSKERMNFNGSNDELCSRIVAIKIGTEIRYDMSNSGINLNSNILAVKVSSRYDEDVRGIDRYSFIARLTNDGKNVKKRCASVKDKNKSHLVSLGLKGTFLAKPSDTIQVKMSRSNFNCIVEKK